MPTERQHLIFDADDTLWENNVLFERTVDDFIEWLAHPTLEPTAIREILLDIERANATAHGYGSKVFLRSLHDCFEHLARRPTTAADAEGIASLAERVVRQDVELVAEVATTLAELGGRHDLLLLTKGEPAEQQRKIDASGLARYFRAVRIVREKQAAVYVALGVEEGLDPSATWMVGNSIRSDVNPALEAGFGAVFVPNDNTWALEHDELRAGAERLLTLDRLSLLLEHF